VDRSSINKVRHGARYVGLGFAFKIEKATNGEVRAEDLPLSPSARDSLAAYRGSAREGSAA